LNKNDHELFFYLDEVTQKVIISSNKKFKIISTPLSTFNLGFIDNDYINSKEYKAKKIYDLRADNKVQLYLNNINDTTPFAILNPTSTSTATINFERLISLDKIDILFKDSKGRYHDFYNLEHNISLQIEVNLNPDISSESNHNLHEESNPDISQNSESVEDHNNE
jgi:hypothetical protein